MAGAFLPSIKIGRDVNQVQGRYGQFIKVCDKLAWRAVS